MRAVFNTPAWLQAGYYLALAAQIPAASRAKNGLAPPTAPCPYPLPARSHHHHHYGPRNLPPPAAVPLLPAGKYMVVIAAPIYLPVATYISCYMVLYIYICAIDAAVAKPPSALSNAPVVVLVLVLAAGGLPGSGPFPLVSFIPAPITRSPTRCPLAKRCCW